MKKSNLKLAIVGMVFSLMCLAIAPPVNMVLAAEGTPARTDHFQVEWGGTNLGFLSVEGLEAKIEVLEYRDGLDPNNTPHKVPGQVLYSNIILRRLYSANDNELFNWFYTHKLNTIEKRDITIQVLNENHDPIVTFKVNNAWPCAYRGPQLVASNGGLAVEEIELTHEGFIVEND